MHSIQVIHLTFYIFGGRGDKFWKNHFTLDIKQSDIYLIKNNKNKNATPKTEKIFIAFGEIGIQLVNESISSSRHYQLYSPLDEFLREQLFIFCFPFPLSRLNT